MTTIFKQNTRFDVLNETHENEKVKINKKNQNSTKQNSTKQNSVESEVKKFNSFKNEPQYEAYNQNKHNTYSKNIFETKKRKEQIEKENLQKEIQLKEIREKEKTESLKETNFPVLAVKTNNKNNQVSTQLNFLQKANTVKIKQELEQPIINIIPPGMCEISFDKKTRKIVYNAHEETQINNDDDEEEINPTCVLNSLVYMHNKRKIEYIEFWGEEEYNKMFISPNYDYHYFDKLDQKYEENMEQLREQDMEECYE